MRKKIRRKKGPVQSKKISYDGINFASGLEKYMYMALRKAKISALYEGQTYELSRAFDFPFESYERCGNGKGDYKNRGNKKILNIKYTPDFVGKHFIIETKGRANESFPLRWKLFKKLIAEDRLDPFTLYKPQNHKECDETVKLIINKQKEYASMGS
tara:strand:+ start:1436 stop:1906 length:471 start_codon:yes stop_codon:yes gene_type:complete